MIAAPNVGGVASPKSASTSGGSTSHQTLTWIISAVVVVLLWQVKSIHPILRIFLGLIILGILLKFFPTIKSQFQALN